MAWHSSFCFIASSLFWVESKKVQPLIFLLLFLPIKVCICSKTALSYSELQTSFKCTEAFPLKKHARMDFDNLMWQKKKKKYKKNFGKVLIKFTSHLGGDIETMLLPKTV